jgi:hypothetical protein
MGARRELQRTVAKPFQQPAEQALWTRLRSDPADIVNARGEHPVLPPERLRVPAPGTACCSSISTRLPRLARAAAAASPPMPDPITIACRKRLSNSQ